MNGKTKEPLPVVLGRVSLWSGILGIVGLVLPYVVQLGLLRFLAAAMPPPLFAGLLGIGMLAGLVATVAGIASLIMSQRVRKLNRSGLVGFLLGMLVLASPFLAMLLVLLTMVFGGGRNF